MNSKMSKEVNLEELKHIDWSFVKGSPRRCKKCSKTFYKRAENNCHQPCIQDTPFYTKKKGSKYTCMLNGIDGHQCDIVTSNLHHMQRHLAGVLNDPSFRCNHCKQEFVRKSNLFTQPASPQRSASSSLREYLLTSPSMHFLPFQS